MFDLVVLKENYNFDDFSIFKNGHKTTYQGILFCGLCKQPQKTSQNREDLLYGKQLRPRQPQKIKYCNKLFIFLSRQP